MTADATEDVTDFETVDYFFDPALVPDPYPYYDYLRSQCPVRPASPHGVVAIAPKNSSGVWLSTSGFGVAPAPRHAFACRRVHE